MQKVSGEEITGKEKVIQWLHRASRQGFSLPSRSTCPSSDRSDNSRGGVSLASKVTEGVCSAEMKLLGFPTASAIDPFQASRLDLEVQQLTDDRDSLRIG